MNAYGHNYYSVIKEPTCVEGGYTTHTCETCSDSYTDNYTNATGIHIYENGSCIQCNGYLESDHNYSDLFDQTWTIHRKGATSITLTFSSNTFVEQRYDFIYLYDGNNKLIGEYTGGELAARSITVSGDTVKIRLKTDRSQTYYGFKLTDISAEYAIEYSTGDLNADGETDIRDLIRLKKILAGKAETDGASADVDNNGKTDASDLAFLRKFILDIIAA